MKSGVFLLAFNDISIYTVHNREESVIILWAIKNDPIKYIRVH